jgi:prepilin-type N-terminal cleavage/methylation domain-containing protein
LIAQAHYRCRRAAFTLVEMIVVVAIILVVLGITLPALTSLWDERKLAEAQNVVQGLLMTTHARAMQDEAGLFFFVDDTGMQRIVPLERVEPEDLGEASVLADQLIQVFEITPGRDYALPVPMRAVPRYVVDEEDSEREWEGFDAVELANNSFANPPNEANVAQTHRNYFAMLYSGGELVDLRDVLIQDADENQDGIGDITGLRVGKDADDPEVKEYWSYDADDEERKSLDSEGRNRTVPRLITDEDDVAINFRSVDGLLVYDDSLFNEAGAGASAQKRDFLLRTAQPFYVNRFTGVVIRGPAGEGVTP